MGYLFIFLFGIFSFFLSNNIIIYFALNYGSSIQRTVHLFYHNARSVHFSSSSCSFCSCSTSLSLSFLCVTEDVYNCSIFRIIFIRTQTETQQISGSFPLFYSSFTKQFSYLILPNVSLFVVIVSFSFLSISLRFCIRLYHLSIQFRSFDFEYKKKQKKRLLRLNVAPQLRIISLMLSHCCKDESNRHTKKQNFLNEWQNNYEWDQWVMPNRYKRKETRQDRSKKKMYMRKMPWLLHVTMMQIMMNWFYVRLFFFLFIPFYKLIIHLSQRESSNGKSSREY